MKDLVVSSPPRKSVSSMWGDDVQLGLYVLTQSVYVKKEKVQQQQHFALPSYPFLYGA